MTTDDIVRKIVAAGSGPFYVVADPNVLLTREKDGAITDVFFVLIGNALAVHPERRARFDATIASRPELADLIRIGRPPTRIALLAPLPLIAREATS